MVVVSEWCAVVTKMLLSSRAQADKIVEQDTRIRQLEEQLVEKEDSIQWLKDQVDMLERSRDE